MTGFRRDFYVISHYGHQYGISLVESQTFPLVKRPSLVMSEEKRLSSQATGLASKRLFRAKFTETNGLNKIVDSRDKIVLIDGETLEDSLRELRSLHF